MTIGIDLLAAICQLRSRAALFEVTDELLSTDEERRVHTFVRGFVDMHNQFPRVITVRRETRVRLPEVVEPYTYYLEQTKRRALYNAIKDPYAALTESLQASGRPDMATVIDAIDALSTAKSRFIDAGTGTETSVEVLERVGAEFETALLDHGLQGVPSGWDEVDNETGGYSAGDLITWVGRPARGKSWLLIWQAYWAWRAGYRVLFVSMEMSSEAIMRRFVGIHSRINPHMIKTGTISTMAAPLVRRAFQEMSEYNPIIICTANFKRSVSQIDAFVERYLPDVVYVDASYLLQPNKKRYGSSGRRETISDTTEEMKELASNAMRPFIQTVQFNRTAEKSRRTAQRQGEGDDENEQVTFASPVAHLGLDKIGETDVIGQVSTHVFGIELPMYPYQAQMRVFGTLKGREGESGYWYCNYPATRTSPIDLSIVQPDDPRLVILNSSGVPRRRVRNNQRTDLGFMRGTQPGQRNAA